MTIEKALFGLANVVKNTNGWIQVIGVGVGMNGRLESNVFTNNYIDGHILISSMNKHSSHDPGVDDLSRWEDEGGAIAGQQRASLTKGERVNATLETLNLNDIEEPNIISTGKPRYIKEIIGLMKTVEQTLDDDLPLTSNEYHQHHCCKAHGCDFGKDNVCCVVNGKAIQKFSCDDCKEALQHLSVSDAKNLIELAKFARSAYTNPFDFSSKRVSKLLFGLSDLIRKLI